MQHLRRERLPVLGADGLVLHGGQRGTLGHRGGFDHADAGALDQVADELAERVARAEVDDPQLGRIAGFQHRLDAGRPIDVVEQHFGGQLARTGLLEAAGVRPGHGLLDGIGHQRRVERQRDLQVFEDGPEHRAAADLLVTQCLLTLVLLAGLDLEGGKSSG